MSHRREVEIQVGAALILGSARYDRPSTTCGVYDRYITPTTWAMRFPLHAAQFHAWTIPADHHDQSI